MLFHYEIHHLNGLSILASGKTTEEKTVFGKGTQTCRWNCYILMNREECRFQETSVLVLVTLVMNIKILW